MENVVDALIMAGSVLLLIIGLTVSMSSFSNLRLQVDEIFRSDEAVDMAQDSSQGYINYYEAEGSQDATIRVVGVETVMSSIRRLVRESYVVYIQDSGLISEVKDVVEAGDSGFNSTVETRKINGEEYLRLSTEGLNYKNLDKRVMGAIYDYLGKSTVRYDEYVGIYQQDLEDVSSANRQTLRIITYKRHI